MGARDYSLTAADNINVAGISIAEGMARSSINNALRGMLADTAELLRDFGGEVPTAGSGGAYTIFLPSGPTAYGINMFFICRLNHDAGGVATMNINGLGPKALGKRGPGATVSLDVGDAPAGHRAMCIYSEDDDAVIMLNPAIYTDSTVAAFMTDPTSAKLAEAMPDEIGSPGQLMFSGVMDTDPLLSANSDARLATQKATKAFIATAFDAVMDPDPLLTADSDDLVATQRATKAYVDAAAVGIRWTSPVLLATTGNITLGGEQTIDGILTSADRVLVKNQASAAQNGVYVSAAGAWARATDADTGGEMFGLGVFVESGTTQQGASFVCTNDVVPTLGTTAITFAMIGATAVYTAGTGLQLVGTQFSIADDELLALGSVASAADRVPYFTGPGTATYAAYTDTGRALTGAASVDAVKGLLGLSTGSSTQFATIELGHATDTTLSRSSAGNLAVEGNLVYRVGGTDVAVTDGGTGASVAVDARTNLGLGATSTPQFTAIELGHATDTTLTRINAGRVAVEGNELARLASANAFTASNTFAGMQSVTNTSAGNKTIALALSNASSTVASETVLDLIPNLNGVNARGAQVAAVNVSNTQTQLVLRTSNSAAPADALSIEPDRSIRLHGYTTGALVTDGSGIVANSPLASSNYTPIVSDTANITATTSPFAYYTQLGSTVTVFGGLNVDAISDGISCSLDLSLPVASDFTSPAQLRGFFGANDFPAAGMGVMTADTVNNRAQVTFMPGGTGSNAYSFQFMYRVV